MPTVTSSENDVEVILFSFPSRFLSKLALSLLKRRQVQLSRSSKKVKMDHQQVFVKYNSDDKPEIDGTLVEKSIELTPHPADSIEMIPHTLSIEFFKIIGGNPCFRSSDCHLTPDTTLDDISYNLGAVLRQSKQEQHYLHKFHTLLTAFQEWLRLLRTKKLSDLTYEDYASRAIYSTEEGYPLVYSCETVPDGCSPAFCIAPVPFNVVSHSTVGQNLLVPWLFQYVEQKVGLRFRVPAPETHTLLSQLQHCPFDTEFDPGSTFNRCFDLQLQPDDLESSASDALANFIQQILSTSKSGPAEHIILSQLQLSGSGKTHSFSPGQRWDGACRVLFPMCSHLGTTDIAKQLKLILEDKVTYRKTWPALISLLALEMLLVLECDQPHYPVVSKHFEHLVKAIIAGKLQAHDLDSLISELMDDRMLNSKRIRMLVVGMDEALHLGPEFFVWFRQMVIIAVEKLVTFDNSLRFVFWGSDTNSKASNFRKGTHGVSPSLTRIHQALQTSEPDSSIISDTSTSYRTIITPTLVKPSRVAHVLQATLSEDLSTWCMQPALLGFSPAQLLGGVPYWLSRFVMGFKKSTCIDGVRLIDALQQLVATSPQRTSRQLHNQRVLIRREAKERSAIFNNLVFALAGGCFGELSLANSSVQHLVKSGPGLIQHPSKDARDQSYLNSTQLYYCTVVLPDNPLHSLGALKALRRMYPEVQRHSNLQQELKAACKAFTQPPSAYSTAEAGKGLVGEDLLTATLCVGAAFAFDEAICGDMEVVDGRFKLQPYLISTLFERLAASCLLDLTEQWTFEAIESKRSFAFRATAVRQSELPVTPDLTRMYLVGQSAAGPDLYIPLVRDLTFDRYMKVQIRFRATVDAAAMLTTNEDLLIMCSPQPIRTRQVKPGRAVAVLHSTLWTSGQASNPWQDSQPGTTYSKWETAQLQTLIDAKMSPTAMKRSLQCILEVGCPRSLSALEGKVRSLRKLAKSIPARTSRRRRRRKK
eukprot:gnl/Dysnectes_brevis/761_a836_2224.p1 GENE.gnl/Dysnectes_brevis/761_a836_2224~~gnl/Dysnectes_brevis/761_a836_2224.p1  ORF type:complete len:986 (-),score=114.20 gnl/Dysnectes_brevis/761_a836_2224:1609-4566(-)